jgi:hypothetical protein
MGTPVRDGSKRSLFSAFTSPFSDKKEPAKKSRTDDQGVERTESVGVSGIQETVLDKVMRKVQPLLPQGDPSDPMAMLIPALVTAVSVAVGEVVKGVVAELEEKLTTAVVKPPPSHEKMMAVIRNLSYENDRLQQYSRRESVRVFGIPTEAGESAESVEEKAMRVFKDAGMEMKKEDIAVAHRVGKENKGSKPILVKFVSRRTRNEVMRAKKSLKGKQAYKNVYINDDITPLRSRLLGYVKKLEVVHRAWTVDGRIYCALKGGDPKLQKPVIIETPDDLFRLPGVKGVDYAALGLSHLAECEMMDE